MTPARQQSQQAQLSSAVSSFSMAAGGAALTLHREVDETVDACLGQARLLRGLCEMGEQITAMLRGVPRVAPGCFIDPDDVLIDGLDEVIRSLESLLENNHSKRSSIDRDAALSRSQRDMLHSAYHDFIGALDCMIEAAKNMKAAIIGLDLRAETRNGERHASADAQIAALRAA